jgi:NADPH oxidase
MPIDRTLYYHKLSGRIALIGTIGHAWAFYIDPRYQASNATIRAKLASSFVGSVNTAGSIMTLILFLIILSSLPFVRRRLFELFYYMHILCASGIVMGAFLHTGILVPLLVACTWGVDLFFRSLVMARHRYPTKARIRTLSATVIELSFPKVEGFDYNPGQYIYLCLPELSYLEWHPFSISSAPKMKNVTLHIRRAGNWTSSLYKLAEQGNEVDILIEGPYGNLGVDVFGDRYKMVILVSGGIGSK